MKGKFNWDQADTAVHNSNSLNSEVDQMLNKVENIDIRNKAFDPLENFEFHINYPLLAMH